MIKVIGHARIGYAELVSHSGRHACKVCGKAYIDHSRTSKVCPTHRDEYRRKMAAQRSKKRARKAA